MFRPLHLSVMFPLLLAGATVYAQGSSTVTELPTAKPEDVGMSSAKLALVKPTLQKFVDEGKVAGAVAIAARHGKVVLFDAVGWQDIEANRPMARDSIFRFYSMTKPLTSVSIMMLVEEGKVGLDDAVSKHVPELGGVNVFVKKDGDDLQTAELTRAPTVRDLLRHTSGHANRPAIPDEGCAGGRPRSASDDRAHQRDSAVVSTGHKIQLQRGHRCAWVHR